MLRRFFKSFTVTEADAGLVCLVALYVIAGYFIAFRFDALHFYNPVMYVQTGIAFTNVLILSYMVLWALWAFYIMIFKRPRELRVFLWDNLKRNALNKERYIKALPVFIACIFLLSTFTSLKVMIPYVNGFKWDEAFADLDVMLHGGQEAWALLHPLLGHPPVTLVINFVYNIWLLVLYIGLYWQLLSLKDPHTRMQFFYTLVMCWGVLGSFMAMYFSSGGPCFYEQILDSERYLPLMDYLRAIDEGLVEFGFPRVWALINQENLWEAYITKKHGIGAGISAMPSVHVSTALLFMLAGLRSEWRFWRVTGVVYFIFILTGSVHLAWHYAVDGYVAVIVTLALWFLAGFMLRKIGDKTAQ